MRETKNVFDTEGFGQRLSKARREKGINQKDFAEKIKITANTMSGLEKGNKKPSLDMVIILSQELDVSVDYLLFGTTGVGVSFLSLMDMAGQFLRLSHFEGCRITSDPEKGAYIEFDNPDLKAYFDDFVQVQEFRQKSGTDEKAISGILEKHLSARRTELENIYVKSRKRTNKDDQHTVLIDNEVYDTDTAECSEECKVVSFQPYPQKERGRKPIETLASAADTINDPQENRPKITTEE